jgi:hypothetical protein
MSRDINLTIPAGFTGEIRFTEDGFTVRPLRDAPPTEEAHERTADDARIVAILDRYARHTPDARAMYAGLVGQGWTVEPPKPTKAEKNDEYLRVVYVGRIERVALYFNTRNITCASTAVRGYAATLPTADQRPNGNVCFYYDGSHDGTVETALAAAAALIAFADSGRSA